ncbi:hypothetical protein R3I93_019112 [Phoxinus phoxinus]|uniref:Immunoglobulin V-set domain-containing protein n=1 Tax=Phoxinus phoxinus TaxID=58324 RepID=A0AAN9CEI8_9TELE
MIGLLFVLVTCWVGIVAAAAAVDDDKDEIESLGVSEGENLTIAIHIKKSDKDPQVLVTRSLLKGSSQEPIAHLICHDGDCVREGWVSGVSLIYDGGNVTLILMNVSYNQTGLYTVCKLSDTPLENKSYNVTVYPAPLSVISPSVMYSKSSAVLVLTILVLIIVVLIITGAIGVVYWKRSKETSYKVSQNDDTAASSLCGSLNVIDI